MCLKTSKRNTTRPERSVGRGCGSWMPPRQTFVQLGFFPLPLAQPYAWTAAILVYELDARSFQRAPNG